MNIFRVAICCHKLRPLMAQLNMIMSHHFGHYHAESLSEMMWSDYIILGHSHDPTMAYFGFRFKSEPNTISFRMSLCSISIVKVHFLNFTYSRSQMMWGRDPSYMTHSNIFLWLDLSSRMHCKWILSRF